MSFRPCESGGSSAADLSVRDQPSSSDMLTGWLRGGGCRPVGDAGKAQGECGRRLEKTETCGRPPPFWPSWTGPLRHWYFVPAFACSLLAPNTNSRALRAPFYRLLHSFRSPPSPSPAWPTPPPPTAPAMLSLVSLLHFVLPLSSLVSGSSPSASSSAVVSPHKGSGPTPRSRVAKNILESKPDVQGYCSVRASLRQPRHNAC